MTAGLGDILAETTSSPTHQFKFVDKNSYGIGFGTREHVRNLHPSNTRQGGVRKGVVSFAQRVRGGDKNWREWTVPAGGNAVLHAEELLRRGDVEDLYVSQCTFGRWRGVADLTGIGASFVDLDYQNRVRWKGTHPRDVASAVIGVLEEQRIPLPSYILSTGRGLCCVWLTELLPPIVLPRWNLLQRKLMEALVDFGSDKRALDAARVFRLVGSVNSNAEWDRRIVGMVWYQGRPEAPTRHQFSILADEVLPHTSAELVSLRAVRAQRKAEGKEQDVKRSQSYTQGTLWSTTLEDLHKLRRHRNPVSGSLPKGQRDAWIFVAAAALAWLAPADVMEREIRVLASQVAGWQDKETAARMCAVIKRARQSEEGKLMLYNGREVDPRYRLRADTIVDWLAIEPGEMRDADLRVLVDASVRTERAAERQTAHRRRQGAKDRDEQQARRREIGGMALYKAARDGMSVRDLAAHFGVSVGYLSRAMNEARGHQS